MLKVPYEKYLCVLKHKYFSYVNMSRTKEQVGGSTRLFLTPEMRLLRHTLCFNILFLYGSFCLFIKKLYSGNDSFCNSSVVK